MWWISLLLIFYILPMAAFQTVHSIATGNGSGITEEALVCF
ncbi:MAG: hypothetical protein U0T85_06705 [Cloacibacterium normanense]